MAKLFTEFPSIRKATWLEKVEKDLKGKPMEALEWQLEENIRLAPFYTASDVEKRKPFQLGNDWEIGEDIVVTDEKVANERLLYVLSKGVNSPRLILQKKCNWSKLLSDVHTEMIALQLLDESDNVATFKAFMKGKTPVGAYQNSDLSVSDCLSLNAIFPKLRTFTVSTDATQEISTQLANLIDAGKSFLETTLRQGIEGKKANDSLQFQLVLGRQYFVAIASIRALKLLWANILRAYQIEADRLPPIDVHIAPNAYGDDIYTNMIRASSIGLSAVVAGASRLTILPANALKEAPNEFTSRVARNVQHLMKMESYLDRVGDPAAGSYYIEQLTDKLAEVAWAKFCDMERN